MIPSAPSVAPAAFRVADSEIKTIVVRGGSVRLTVRSLRKISTGKASSQKSVQSGVQTRALPRSAALVPGLQTYSAGVPSALNRWRRLAPRNQASHPLGGIPRTGRRHGRVQPSLGLCGSTGLMVADAAGRRECRLSVDQNRPRPPPPDLQVAPAGHHLFF
jgi:hypothetical protein